MKRIVFFIFVIFLLLTSCNNKVFVFQQKPFSSAVTVETKHINLEFELEYVSSNNIVLKVIKPFNLKGVIFVKQNDSVLLKAGTTEINIEKNDLTLNEDIINCFLNALSDFGKREIQINGTNQDFVYTNSDSVVYKACIDTVSNRLKSIEINGLIFSLSY